MEEETKVVEKRGSQYCVVHCHGKDKGKIIKCFPTKEQAERMHRAIMANKKEAEEIFFTDELDYSSIETKKGKEYYVEGYISTKDLDLGNDIVTDECLNDMLEQLKGRTIKLDVEHETMKGESELDKKINKTKIPIGKIVDAWRDEKGIKAKAILNKAHSRFQEVWNSIKNGFLDGFSIAYYPIQTITKNIGDKIVRLLNKVDLINVALTGNPMNPEARLTSAFTKSLSYLNNMEDIMEREEIKDGRPPKEWWDNCVSKAKKFATDANKFCGWLYRQEGGKWGKIRSAFGKSGEMIDTTDLLDTDNTEIKKLYKGENVKTIMDGDNEEREKQENNEKQEEEKSFGELKQETEKLKEEIKTLKEELKKIRDEEDDEEEAKIQEEVKALREEIKKLKNEPQYKARQEDMKAELKDEIQSPIQHPLDMVR